jgi:L-Ala-D/L-Glu epimerase / N-acetyl-D-glutamate racemase
MAHAGRPLTQARLHALSIPFVESFSHSKGERSTCDSVLVQVSDSEGVAGWGEAVPRPYVTGETVDSVLADLRAVWPRLAGAVLPTLDGPNDLSSVESLISAATADLPIGNATHAALEVAILDCALRACGQSLGDLLPPCRDAVTYSGVISGGSIERATRTASMMRMFGLTHFKVKVTSPEDIERVRAVRDAVGSAASIRVDVNGAWDPSTAVAILPDLARAGVECVEEPLRPGPVEVLARLRAQSPLPLMADESLVTLQDARALAAARAVDHFNLRISKCGGLARCMAISKIAAESDIGVQVGCQVGETAVLSAAGRHLSASLAEVLFTEGSYGELLLTEDIARDSVCFGEGGLAPVLAGPGLGIDVVADSVSRLSARVIEL